MSSLSNMLNGLYSRLFGCDSVEGWITSETDRVKLNEYCDMLKSKGCQLPIAGDVHRKCNGFVDAKDLKPEILYQLRINKAMEQLAKPSTQEYLKTIRAQFNKLKNDDLKTRTEQIEYDQLKSFLDNVDNTSVQDGRVQIKAIQAIFKDRGAALRKELIRELRNYEGKDEAVKFLRETIKTIQPRDDVDCNNQTARLLYPMQCIIDSSGMAQVVAGAYALTGVTMAAIATTDIVLNPSTRMWASSGLLSGIMINMLVSVGGPAIVELLSRGLYTAEKRQAQGFLSIGKFWDTNTHLSRATWIVMPIAASLATIGIGTTLAIIRPRCSFANLGNSGQLLTKNAALKYGLGVMGAGALQLILSVAAVTAYVGGLHSLDDLFRTKKLTHSNGWVLLGSTTLGLLVVASLGAWMGGVFTNSHFSNWLWGKPGCKTALDEKDGE